MWLAVFYIWGSLLAFSMCDICPEISEDAASWIKLKPLGHCGDEDNLCPFQLTLPPLSIQLPRSFRELETMAKELQDLKEVVNQLKRDCQECKDRHSIERGEQKDHSEEEEKRPQSLRHNIRINETQSHSGEQVVRIFTSTLPQRDTSEGEGTVKSGVKRLNHSILESQRSNIDQRIDLNPSVTDQRSEISREVKIFNPSLDETPEDISEDKLVVSPTPDERELKSKESELQEPSLPRKKDNLQIATHGKLQPNNLRDGHAKNISSILAARRRVQNLPDVNRLSSISRDANTKTMDLSTSSGNRRVVKISGVGAPLRPKGSYINSRVVNVNSENRLKNPALVRKTNPQAGDMTVKTEPEESGFSPARSGIMRVKETGSHIPNTKPGAISRPIPSTDDQNKQDISRVSGPRTDDGHGLENAGQVTILREDNLRKVNKTEITRLPTKQSKENQGDVSHIATNKSISSVMNQAEQPNIFKEEKKHAGLIESLVVISSEAETSSKVDREDLPFRGRQVENKKYLNPNTETNNGQIDSTILDKAGSTFNERTVNPPSPDLKDKIKPGIFTEGPEEEIGINSPNAGTEKKDIPRHSKAILLEKDLVKPNLAPTVNSKLIDSTASLTSIVQSPAVDQGTRRILITPIKAKAKEELSKNSKDISKIPEVSQDNNGHVMPNLLRNPEMYPTTTIPPRGPKLRQPYIINKLSANRTVGVPLKLSIPVRNSNTGRKNGTGIIKQSYIRKKPISQTETNINRGFKTKVSTVTQFFSPTGATSTVKQEQKEEIKHIPQVTRSNILDNHWLNNSSTESQNAGDVQDLDKVQEDKYRIGDNSETVLISNIGNHAEDPKTQSEASNSPIGGKKSRILNLGTVDTSSQPPFEVKTSSGKKRPTASTLKKELSKKPGTTQFTTPALSFTDTDHDNGTKNIHTITSIQEEEIKHIPQVARSNVLDNHWLNNNSPETQNAGDVQDLDMVQEDKYRIGDNSETVLISNIGNHAEDSKTQSGASNSPIGGKESRILNLGTADISSQPPFEVKTGSGKKRPTASTLKKELSKKPGTTQFTTPALSFMDTDHDDGTKNIHTITSTQEEEIKHIPQVARSNALDNHWLNNNSSETQNAGDVQDLDKVQEDKYRIGDNSETMLLSNIGKHAEDSKTQSGTSNSPIGGKESKILNLGTTDSSSQSPFEVKTGSGKKRPTASTLKKVLSKKPGTPALSFTDTGHDDGTKNIRTITSTHVEMAKNVSQETPISFENIGATRELELIQLNKDRVEGNPGEILSNPNSADTAQGYSEGSYTIPVVLETLTNVEEIKGSKLFSLSPEDTAEGFKSHAVSDEVTEREKVENKSNSTCLSDCNTTSTQQSTTQTRPPLDSGREKGPAQDCADYITKSRRNGVYRATPWLKNSTFPVFCDMESSGGGWTLIQRRFDGSTSFNRTWDEYKNGFGKLIGEFWLGNDKIHLLTKAKNMSLRIEIEDFEGVREYAHYDHFYVANESQQYRLSIGGYSGTAGNAMQFSEKYNHDQKLFTTPDRDNDHYPSGNCGAYYSSGWWFDACMSANLNGKYYQSKYKGVRNGIFWGTWHNITMEYYPTNERQAFKTVRMMIRPKNSAN